MTEPPDSASRVRRLFDEATLLPEAERAAFLDRTCATDPALREEIEALLAAASATGGFLEASSPDRLPERFGPYRPLRRLGRGGMGVVYQARHDGTGHAVALKTVRLQDATLLQAMRREIEALAQLDHPGVVKILDVGVENGVPWYAMALHEGATLHDRIRAAWGGRNTTPLTEAHWWTMSLLPQPGHGRPPSARPQPAGMAGDAVQLREMLTVVRRLCPALAYLHGEGIIHRDLKPSNVLVLEGDRPLLIDFGLTAPLSGGRSREALDAHGLTLGTAAYMPPEQAAGEALDARTDLYALGCILFELLTGDVPLSAPTPEEIIERRRHEDPPAPSALVDGVPEVLDRLVLGLVARRRTDRIGHADAVAEALAAAGASVDAEDPGPAPHAYLYRPGLAGREDALDDLGRHLEAQGQGRGGLVLLSGASGVGKTRLALAFAARAQTMGRLVLTGECAPPLAASEAAGGAPLLPLRRTFEAIVDHCRERGPAAAERIAGARARVLQPYGPFGALVDDTTPLPPMPPEDARRRLLSAASETLLALAREEPACLILDDLQWADELTLDLLLLLARSRVLEREPLLVLGAYRSDEAVPALTELAAACADGLLHLRRLDDGHVAAIVADMLALPEAPPALCEHVARAAEGNPFFVAEYLRAAVATGIVARDGHGRWIPGDFARGGAGWDALAAPGSVEAIIRGRLARLPGDARELTAVAAVLGRSLDAETLLAASGLPGESARRALATLLARDVLEDATGNLRFVHHKIRETAYEAQPQEVLSGRHRACALAIEARHGADDPAHQAALGVHWAGAREPRRARSCFLAAAREAAGRHAAREAVRLYHDFLALAGEPSVERTEGLIELGRALEILGERTASLEALHRALEDAEGLCLPGAHARSAHGIGAAWLGSGNLAAAEKSYQQALAGFREMGDESGESLALLDLGRIHHQAGRMGEARALYAESLDRSRALGDRGAVARALSRVAGFHHDQGRDQEARSAYEEALRLLQEIDDLPRAGAALANIANLDSSRGRTEAAEAGYEEALAIARSTGYRSLEAQVLGNLAVLHTRADRPAQAEALYRQSIQIAREIGNRYAEAFSLIYLGEIARGAGRLGEARALYEEALAVHRATQDARGEATALGAMALLAVTEGRAPDALALYEESLAIRRALGDLRSEAITLIDVSRLRRRAGDLAAARAASDRAGALLDEAVDPIESAWCLVERGHVALAHGVGAGLLLARARALADRATVPDGSELRRVIASLEAAIEASGTGHPLRYGELVS